MEGDAAGKAMAIRGHRDSHLVGVKLRRITSDGGRASTESNRMDGRAITTALRRVSDIRRLWARFTKIRP